MKKFICLWLVCFLILLAGCGKKPSPDSSRPGTNSDNVPSTTAQESEEMIWRDTPPEPFDPENFDWESCIRAEIFDLASPLGQAIAQAVTIEVTGASEAELQITLSAYNIYDELTAWWSETEEVPTETDLEAEILALLAGESTSTSYTLTYRLVNSNPVIFYDHAFLNAASCGILDFYADVYEDILVEIGGAENG